MGQDKTRISTLKCNPRLSSVVELVYKYLRLQNSICGAYKPLHVFTIPEEEDINLIILVKYELL